MNVGLRVLGTGLLEALGGLLAADLVMSPVEVAVGIDRELDRGGLVLGGVGGGTRQERKQLELQINKYILDGPEKYLKQIDEMFDKIGAIEATIMKERLRSQIQMKKYITTEQYMRAKEIAIKRLSK